MPKCVLTVVMLSGYLQSGKDTVGKILTDDFNFTRYAFADVLKDEVAQMFHLDRASLDTQEGKKAIIDVDGKQISVRDILITYGQKRRAEYINHWIDKVFVKIKNDLQSSQTEQIGNHQIVITDWRFPNEYYHLKILLSALPDIQLHLFSWRIHRWDTPPLYDPTEVALDDFPFDKTFHNDKSLHKLRYMVKKEIYTTMKHLSIEIFLTDVDDVLLQYIEAFRQFILDTGLKLSHDYPTGWDLYGWILDGRGEPVSREDIQQIITHFNRSELFGDLHPHQDARQTLIDLKKLGYHVIAVTSCDDSKHVIKRRRENISRHFDNCIDFLICLPLNSDKKYVLSQFKSSIFIDDSVHHAKTAADVGHKTFLMERPWNVDYLEANGDDNTNIKRVTGWKQIMGLIQS